MMANSKVKVRQSHYLPPWEKSEEDLFPDPYSPLALKGKGGQGEGAMRDPSPMIGVMNGSPPRGTSTDLDKVWVSTQGGMRKGREGQGGGSGNQTRPL